MCDELHAVKYRWVLAAEALSTGRRYSGIEVRTVSAFVNCKKGFVVDAAKLAAVIASTV